MRGAKWFSVPKHVLAAGVAPALLVIVALLQVFNVATNDLSPWKGGGFGMFSTIDAPSKRTVVAEVLTEDGVFLLGRTSLRELEQDYGTASEFRVRVMPDGNTVEELIEAMLTAHWVSSESGRARPSTNDEAVAAWEGQVGVYGMDFDATENRLSRLWISFTRVEADD